MTTVHFDQTTAENIRIAVVDGDGANYIVYVADLDVAQVVGNRRFAHLDQALAYANACVSGVPPHGTFATT